METITGAQIRAARVLAGVAAEDVARSAKVGLATLRRAEASDGKPGITEANLAAIRRALEEAGVVFLADGEVVGGGAGVRLK